MTVDLSADPEGEHAEGMRPDGEGAANASSPEGWAILELPAPPSVNGLWRNKRNGGRVRTDTYIDWLSQAGWRLKAQRPPRICGAVIAVIGVERHSLAADIDNRIKALLDLLVSHQVIEDDKHVVALATAWNPPGNQLVRIVVAPARDGMSVTFHLADPKGAFGGWFLDAPPTNGDDDGVEPL